MAERAIEVYLTIDGSANLKAQVSEQTFSWIVNNIDITNMGSGGMVERTPTTYDLRASFNLINPNSDESNAASLFKILYDGSLMGGGDSIYTVVMQKVSSGGTGGTATTKDPTYTFAGVLDGGWSPIMGNPGGLVGGGQTITFLNATAATYARATA